MESRLNINAAGTGLGIHCSDGDFAAALEARYLPFSGCPKADIDIGLRVVPELDTRTLRERGIDHTLNERDRVYLKGRGFCGEVRLDRRAGDIQVLDDRPIEAFGLAFRHLFTRLAVDSGLTFVHAAGAVKGGRAFLFAGPSGAGKSTVAGMLGGTRIIHDDQLFLDDGGSGPAIRAVPYMGEDRFVHDMTGSWPVEAVYLLVQDERAFVREVEPGIAAARLVAAPLEWIDDPPDSFREWLQRTLERCSDVVAEARCRELHFSLTELPAGLTEARRNA